MAVRKYANNAASAITGAISAGATGLNVSTGDGGLFPTLAGGNWAIATLDDGSGAVEIVKVTARSTDYFTVTRGQEGTSPTAFPAGTAFELRTTAASFDTSANIPGAPYVIGDLLYATNTTSFTTLADVADGKVLHSGGVATAPNYAKVRLSGATNDVTGTLRVPRGGTSLSTFSTGSIMYASGSTTLSKLAIGATNRVLTVSGGLPAWGTSGAFSTRLPIERANLPDASGSGNNPAELARTVSAVTQTSNTPKDTFTVGKFDAATDEHLVWRDIGAANVASAPYVTLTWYMNTATGSRTVWKSAMAVTAVGVAAHRKVFLAAVTGGATNGATAGSTRQVTISLTTTGISAAAGRPIDIFVGRDADLGSDVATGDANLTDVVFGWA